jgi:hypothetical protein
MQTRKKILKQQTDSKCQLYKEHEETINHLISGCPILAKNEYIIRQDRVCTPLHYSICKELGIETTENWYTHKPEPVCEHGDITVLWNQEVQTDREVLGKKPDIIIKNKKDEICLLIDVAIPSDRNVVNKEAEKKLNIET